MSHSHVEHSSVKTYILVFIGLGILTGMTVLLSYAGFSHSVGISLAALIALVKCVLIATFFMHLRFERKWLTYIVITALFLVAVLVGSLIQDIGIGR